VLSRPLDAMCAVLLSEIESHTPTGRSARTRLYPADLVVRIPDAISDAQAAASFLRGVTARLLLKEVVTLQPGDTVLFHAAAGGVGLLFAQWARALGIRVIGTVSDESKAAVARTAGCFEVINYSKENFVERVHTITTAPEWQLSTTQSASTRSLIRCGRCDRAAPWWCSARHQVIRRRSIRLSIAVKSGLERIWGS
jgi:NADPH:quinone reductase-like Zn-dependent oxidoreductase